MPFSPDEMQDHAAEIQRVFLRHLGEHAGKGGDPSAAAAACFEEIFQNKELPKASRFAFGKGAADLRLDEEVTDSSIKHMAGLFATVNTPQKYEAVAGVAPLSDALAVEPGLPGYRPAAGPISSPADAASYAPLPPADAVPVTQEPIPVRGAPTSRFDEALQKLATPTLKVPVPAPSADAALGAEGSASIASGEAIPAPEPVLAPAEPLPKPTAKPMPAPDAPPPETVVTAADHLSGPGTSGKKWTALLHNAEGDIHPGKAGAALAVFGAGVAGVTYAAAHRAQESPSTEAPGRGRSA